MKFGIFSELSIPRPITPESERKAIWSYVDEAVLADQLGFDYVWVVEHHFLEEYSHSSAPDLFLSILAGRTEHIRLGHGVVTCVPEINNPIRVAERAAFLDVLSNGRLELGTGRSSTWTELGGFNANPDDTKKAWSEYVHVLPQMWSQERFSYDGTTFSMPERAILPRPVQQPHPPMWVAVSSPGTEIDAAERGLGWLGVNFSGYAAVEERIKGYREVIANAKPASGLVNDKVFLVNFLYCHEDEEHALDVGSKLANKFQYLADQNLHTREVVVTPAYQTFGGLPTVAHRDTAGDKERSVPEGACIGTPEQIIERVRRWGEVGVDGVNFVVNTAGSVGHEAVEASMRLFAEKVIPHCGDIKVTLGEGK